MIIGICGLIGSGKDTVADFLVNNYNYKKESFAAALKDAASVVFNWDRNLLEGRTVEAREWREQVDAWWSKRLNIPHLTPRFILQNWGTELFRGHFHDDIWIATVENKLRLTTDNIVITDCRFPNEIEAIRKLGGKIIRIKRGIDPDWYHVAEIVNARLVDNSFRENYKILLENYKIHASESSWAGTKFDLIIENNDTVEALYSQIKNLAEGRLVSI